MARRVNKKFLIILSVLVMGGLICAALLSHFMTRGSAREWAEKGRQHMADGEFREARDAFARALRDDQHNIELIVALGDAAHQLTRYDIDEIGKDVGYWERAREISPGYQPVLNRLFDAAIVLAEVHADPLAFGRLRDKAQDLHRHDPSNVRAQAYIHIGLIGAWLTGGAHTEQQVEESVAALIELMPQVPDDAEIPFNIARAKVQLAQNRYQRNDPSGARRLQDEARSVFEDALKASPENSGLLFRYAIVLRATGGGGGKEEQEKQFQNYADLITQARSFSKPEDADHPRICLALADLLIRQGKLDEAEREVADLLELRPNDQRVRHAMAAVWRRQPGKRDRAIELLAREPGDNPDLVGFRARQKLPEALDRLVELVQLRMEAYVDGSKEADRPAIRRAIDESLARAEAMVTGELPELMKLKGRVLLLDNDVRSRNEAIRVLQRAADQLEQARRTDPELIFLLARTYAVAGQNGQAKGLLEQLLKRHPESLPARKILASILAGERDYDALEQHLVLLEKAAPADLDVIRMRIALLRARDQQDTIMQLVQALPEETEQQRALKAEVATTAGDAQTAERLLLPLHVAELEQAPGAFPASRLLVRLYMRIKDNERASQIVEKVLARNPTDRTWPLIQLAVSGKATREQLAEVWDNIFEEMEDPVQREIQRYRVWVDQGQMQEAFERLLEAEKTTGGDGQILDLIFSHAIDIGKLEVAEAYAEKLARTGWDQAGGLYYRTRLMLARGDLDGALRRSDELVQRVPEFARNWVLHGQVRQAARQFDNALTSYGRALDKQTDNFEALRGMVDCHLEKGQLSLARDYLARGLKTASAPYFREMALRVEEQHGDPRSVTAEREKNLSAHPGSSRALVALIENYVRVADHLITRDERPAAAPYLEKARAKLAEAVEKWPDDATFYAKLADLSMRENEPQQGVTALEELAAREKWKDRHEPALMLGTHLFRMGEEHWDRAEQAFQEAIRKSDGAMRIRQYLVNFYAQTGRWDKQIALLTDMYTSTQDAAIHRQLIEIQVVARRYAEAEKSLQAAVARNPRDATFLSLMAYVKLAQRQDPEAADFIRRALAENPDHVLAIYYRGLLKLQTDDLPGAVDDLRRAKELGPTNVDILLALSEVLQRRNQVDQAAAELQLATRLAPHRPELRYRLIKLYTSNERWAAAERLLEEAKHDSELSHNPIWWLEEARMWKTRGDLRKAAQAIQVAAQKRQSDHEILKEFMDLMIRVGAYEHLVRFTEPVASNPETFRPYWLHMHRGVALVALKKQEEALREFDRAFAEADAANDDEGAELLSRKMVDACGAETTIAALSARRHPRWAIALAQTYWGTGDWTTAVEVLDELFAGEFKSLPDLQKLKGLRIGGQIYHTASATQPSAFAKAERAYLEYLELLDKTRSATSMKLEALNNLATLLAEHATSPEPNKALIHSTRAYQLMLESNAYEPAIADTHGWVLVLCDRIDEGIEHLRTAGSKARPPVEIFYHLGEAYLRKAQPEEAVAQLEKAQTMVQDYERRSQFVDPALPPKIVAALERARQELARAVSATP